jgi:RIO kinase 1
MDIKNISDFFCRKGVHTLPERTVFEFITALDGPRAVAGSNEQMVEALQKLFSSQINVGEEGRHRDDKDDDVDTAVFRQQYIPQTLEQVYDVERDVDKVRQGQARDLVYRGLLADKLDSSATPSSGGVAIDGVDGSDHSGGVSVPNSESESNSDAEVDRSSEADHFAKKPPRGRRFENKDVKRDHKRLVKEEKREQRSKKIPKHIKKKLINASKRK